MPEPSVDMEAIQRAAAAIRSADALLIGAGAGMGVDSGLPDFRGNEGFWTAYPPFRGRRFAEMSTPHWFESDPELAWGFFGHRLNLYRAKSPHAGFIILRNWAQSMSKGYFVFTSNVDGHFQRAGFDAQRVLECHGSIHHLQCARPCCDEIWAADSLHIEVDEATIRATSELPHCPRCGGVARPNILMFNDWNWVESRTAGETQRYERWLKTMAGNRLVAIELGAGLAIPTVRMECQRHSTTLIRINPREAETGSVGVSLAMGALAALREIDERLRG
jgi:NAD-dependent SIR2 family protein deacetylase